MTESLLKNPPKVSHDPEAVYKAAKAGIAKQNKLALLKPMAYQNTYAVAVKKDFATENGISKITDLAKVQDTAKAGFTLEFNDRQDGNKGLTSLYGLNLNVATMEPALRYQAIQSNKVQIIDAYSTDAELVKYNLVALKDDKQLFPPYQGAPLLRQSTLKKYPKVKTALNKLAGKISEKEMQSMNYNVGVEGKSAKTVAKTYLEKEGLLN